MLFCTLSISPSISSSSVCNDSIKPSNSLFIVWIESISAPMLSILSLKPSISVFKPLTLNSVNAKKVIQITIKIFVYRVPLINNVPY